jgi:AcrR family transcriptional regulator
MPTPGDKEVRRSPVVAGSGRPAGRAAGQPAGEPGDADDGPGPIAPAASRSGTTRERILDVALDLFIAQGFDGTSLREIAERLGFTKAALYYHFTSKDDILMALHLRLHEFGREALAAMGDEPVTLGTWGRLLDGLVDQMISQRRLFALHQRNPAALEKLHRQDHMTDHEDIQARFGAVLGDTRVALRDRVRMASSFGVVFGGLILSGDAFSSASNRDLGAMLREAIWDVLQG